MALGMIPKMARRQWALSKIKGNRNTAAQIKRNNVRENGLTKLERCWAAINEPATSTVAAKTIIWAFKEGFSWGAC